jgi:hypothetical protein
MANTNNLQDDIGWFMLFKGAPKEGKSIAAHSFPLTYTLDFDNKIRAVKNWGASHAETYSRSFDYDTYDNLIAVKQKCEAFKISCPYKTIIVDGITEAANLAMRCMIAYRNPNWKGAGLTRQTNTDKTVRAGIPMTEIEDFNGESRFLSDLIDDLRVINIEHKVNIIVCAHVITHEVTDFQGRTVSTTKRLITAGNKIGASLPGKFEEVMHFERTTAIDPNASPQFMCYCRDHNGNGAGTTLPLPDMIEWTNSNFYEKITKMIKGEIF